MYKNPSTLNWVYFYEKIKYKIFYKKKCHIYIKMYMWNISEAYWTLSKINDF